MSKKYNNDFNVDHAAPGFCTLCHCEIAEFRGSIEISPGIFKPRIVALKSNFRTRLLELSDGTFMSISTCDKCENFTPEDCGKIMESEVRGWSKEIADFKLPDKVSNDIETKKKLFVVDVPDKGWTSAEKASISMPDHSVKEIKEEVKEEVKESTLEGEVTWEQSQEPTPIQPEP